MNQSQQNSAGFSLLEVLISVSLAGFLIVGSSMKFIGMRQELEKVSKLMALDAFEASLSDFIGSEGVARHSLSKALSPALKDCFINKRFCRHGQGFRLKLYREGQNQPFAGEGVSYDKEGQLCAGSCKGGFEVRAAVVPQCVGGLTCAGPAYTLVVADIYLSGDPKPLRQVVRELEKNRNGKFPGLQLSCPQPEGVLYGIGLQGEALCVPRQDLVLKDARGRVLAPVAVAPVDCRIQDLISTDQAFVNEIDTSGKLSCAPRFW